MLVPYFYLATLAFVFGVGARTLLPLESSLLLLLIGAVFVLGVGWRYFVQEGVYTAMVVCGVALLFGVWRMDFAWSSVGASPLAYSVGETIELTGTVVREPEQRERSLQLYVQTDTDLVLVSADRYETVRYGDVVLVEGKLKRPEEFVTDLGRTFNYPGYLLARGVEYTVSFPTVTVLGSGQGNIVISNLLRFKQAFVTRLSQVLPEPQHGLGVGLLLGVTAGLGEDIEASFRTSGIIHIVVLSGYNVMLVVTFIMYVVAFALPPRPRLVVGVMAIIAFACLVGLSATVLRASIMAVLFLITQTFGRTYIVLRGLLLAGVIMIVINPYLLVFDVGFQLSFIATLGLILVSPQFETILDIVPKNFKCKEFLIATVATQIAVLPLLLYQIGQLSLIAVIVNVLVLPMVPIAMLLTFITGVATMLWPFLGSILVFPTYLSLEYILFLAQFFASVPLAAVVVPVFPFFVVPLAYAALGYVLYRFRARSNDVEPTSLTDWDIVEEAVVMAQIQADSVQSKGVSPK